ncbi:3-isopropylmalate dehydratase [Microgenomates group bacterium RBG_16_45_19]|nr:MAG: 3-isopropylmalate dehydratase [Microgenomates group bacterium RBG_16_45_19]
MHGRVWKFGDGISTDDIIPGRYFHLRGKLPELAKHVLEDVNPDFSVKVEKGDFVVAGSNFGQGSSREHAATTIRLMGVSAVLAKSFARIFYRNAVNVGLPVIMCNTDLIENGDELEIDLNGGMINNLSKKKKLKTKAIPRFMLRILEDGGLLRHIKKYGKFQMK